MWEAARTRARERALRRRKLGAVAGVAGVLLLLSTLMLPASRAPTPDLEEIAALSARLEATPLDFLLETPGTARLETTPDFGAPLLEERWAAGTESEERT
jgi:hypothetical protein